MEIQNKTNTKPNLTYFVRFLLPGVDAIIDSGDRLHRNTKIKFTPLFPPFTHTRPHLYI